MPPDRSRPDEVAIRRALAECMTVSDIDDAMSWAHGTARRRRWRSPAHGGLPNADAELSGIALWFRSTIEAWQHAQEAPQPSPPDTNAEPTDTDSTINPDDDTAADVLDVSVADVPEVDVPEPVLTELEPSDTRTAAAKDASVSEVREGLEPAVEASTPTEDGYGPDADETFDLDPHGDSPAAPAPPPVPAAPTTIRSGFDLSDGQHVVAEVRGSWREAVVTQRSRTTVMVEYQINDTPLGTRRLRIGIDLVRAITDEA